MPSTICHHCGHVDPQGEAGARCPVDGFALIAQAEHDAHLDDPMLGQVIAGKYPFIGFIGSGSQGAVYRALQEPVGREVVIKVLHQDDELPEAMTEAVRERFVREARIVARLSNPSTVTLHDYGVEPDGMRYMVLEYVRGRPLSKVISTERWMAAGRAVAIVYQMLQSLAEAHAMGLVHRDLKPANVMVVRGSFGEELVKVLDFGIARAESREIGGRLQTKVGMLLGTPRYMSPEQARGAVADARSDLYAVGIILYELLSGAPPFGGDDPMEALMGHISSPIPPLPAEFGVPPALEAALRKALAKSPAERFQSAQVMAQALLDARSTVDAASGLPQPMSGPPGPMDHPATLLLAPSNRARVSEPAPAPQGPPTAITSPEPIPLAAPVAPKPIPLVAAVTPEPPPDEGPAHHSPLPLVAAGMGCALGLVGAVWFFLLHAPPTPAPPSPAPLAQVIPDLPRDPPAREALPPPPEPEPDPGLKVPDPLPEPSDDPKVPPPRPPRIAEGKGLLEVVCKPACNVYVDGVFRGASPLRGLALEPGEHLLWTKGTTGAKSAARPVAIKAGVATREVVDLY